MRPALEDRRNLRRWRARLCEQREFGHRFVPAKCIRVLSEAPKR